MYRSVIKLEGIYGHKVLISISGAQVAFTCEGLRQQGAGEQAEKQGLTTGNNPVSYPALICLATLNFQWKVVCT